MGKRVYKKCISIFLVVCMLVSITPASTCQVKAAGSINIMDITEKAGVFVRGGMNAYEQAKAEGWNCGQAMLGTLKCIGKEMLGLNENSSPGSTVIVNEVDLSQVESELSEIQTQLNKQNITIINLQQQMKDSTDALSKQIADLSSQIAQADKRKSYESYLNDYFKFYNEFCVAIGSSEKILNGMYDGNPTEDAVKNAYDRVYELKGTASVNYRTEVENLGKYICGKYQSTNPGSLIDILCKYYKLAGYNETQISEAIQQFVAQTYYAYCLANYYYMAVTLYQSTYVEENNLQNYKTDYNDVLPKEEIKSNAKEMLKNSMATTAQIFYDLNKHFCSVEDQEVLYEGVGGTTNRTMNGSQMDVEPGSSVSLPDSTQILDAYFGSDYSKMFGNICTYSYEVSDSGVQIEGNKLNFDDSITEGKEITVNMYCTVSDQKIKLHTYTFTCKSGKLSGGYGTVEYPYVMRTVDDYDNFRKSADFSNAVISLEADLDFSTKLFLPVSNEFKGQFFGNGHKISNIDITNISYSSGMFASLSGVVVDLVIENARINPNLAKNSMGIIADTVNQKGRIERCEVIDSQLIYGKNSVLYIGGIAGKVNGGSLKGCLTRNVQIVVGNYQDTNQSGFVGGIAGCVDNSGSIEYCGREEGSLTSWYQGTESSGSYLGGIVGVIYRSTMNNCWSFKTGGTSTDNADFAKNQKIGSFVGLCSNLKSKNNIIYSGTDAETSSVSRVTFSNKQQGDGPQVLQKEDFNCSKVGFEGAGYLTNADSTGNPLRLHPIEMKLYTDTVKKAYYYGENLELNGLRIQLRRGNVGMLGVKLYNVNTGYNAKKAGNYQVKISVGNLNSKFEVTVANKPHTYEQQSITPATCTTEGSVSYKCKDAGCNEVLSSVLSALGHKMEHHKGKQATCKEDGEKEYWYCTRCKKYFLDEKGTKETTKAGLVISATGHKMEHHDRKEATNEQAGNIEYWYCTLCNNYFLDEKGKQQVEKDKVVISVLPVIPDSGKDSDKNNSSTNTTQKKILTKGTSLLDQKTGAVYVITMEGKEVSYKKQSTKKKKIVIPDQVTINGYTYKVTSIADNAFKNNKNITTVIIGKNIKRIGKKAFYGCKSLRNITIKTKLLKKNTVGSKAFTKAGSKNYKKLKVKVPKKKLKLYKKILRKKGLSKKAKMR